MEKGEYKKMFDAEDSYWWYVGRRFIVRDFLERYLPVRQGPVVDVGCGTGINLKLLEEFGTPVIGVDSSKEALTYCRSRGFMNVRLIRSHEVLASHSSVHLITMLDVLEHIRDEADALRMVREALTSDGYLLITVPAYQFLWSEHDIALHHFRRYTADNLRSVLKKNGFSIVRTSYIITFSLPLIIGYRVFKGVINRFLMDRPRTSHVYLPDILNNFFIWLLKIESKIVRNIDLPFGTSIIAIAKKIPNE